LSQAIQCYNWEIPVNYWQEAKTLGKRTNAFRQILLLPIIFSVTALNTTALRAKSLPQQGYPDVESLDFDSTNIPAGRHPFLFFTQDEISQARRRISDPEYAQAWQKLNNRADEARQMQPEPLDRSWWDAVKNKSWNETYPVIYEKTAIEPRDIMLPGYYAALRYAVTRDDRDAETAKKLLLHLSNYSFEFEHYDVGMNYSVWGCRALPVYDLLFEQFGTEQRNHLDAFFARLGRAVLKNDIYWIENNIGGGINNHLAWHKMMLGMLGLFYNHNQLVQYALNGPRGLLSLLELGLVDDGLWCESSLNYHFTAIVPMILFADMLRRADYPQDLYTITTANDRNIRQCFDSMFGVLLPDGTIPPVGDAYGLRRNLADVFCYANAQRVYHDPKYAWLLKRAPRKQPEILFVGADTDAARAPDAAGKLYPEHGYAFLRRPQDSRYWSDKGWCAFLTFDKSGVHTNQDKLSVMLFGCGRLLIPDTEARATAVHAFSAKVQRELNRSALSQNTVMIDEHNQRSISQRLRLQEYRLLPNEQVVTAVDDKGLLYQGVRQSRTVCLRRQYILDVFQVVSDSSHQIDWIAHTFGQLDQQKSTIKLQPANIHIDGPGQWLRDFQQADSDGEIRMQWHDGAVKFRMTLAGQPGTKVILCGYPQTDEPNCPTIPMVLVRRQAAKTTYAVVYQAAADNIPEVHLQGLPDSDGRRVYQVGGPWGSRRHLVPGLR